MGCVPFGVENRVPYVGEDTWTGPGLNRGHFCPIEQEVQRQGGFRID